MREIKTQRRRQRETKRKRRTERDTERERWGEGETERDKERQTNANGDTGSVKKTRDVKRENKY